ncbi:MAG: metallophosphoesterase family protein [Bacteroidetes bacterium]|nr:metallophosphoesterase family protein [Bacteroidota bacterium]
MKIKLLAALFVFSCTNHLYAQTGDKIFYAPPYLQIGTNPSPQSLELLWQSIDSTSKWAVEYTNGSTQKWLTAAAPESHKITIAETPEHLLFRVHLTGLVPGNQFQYRVKKNGQDVFTATAAAPHTADQPFRFAVFGDIGAGTPEAKQIANGMYNAKPNMIVIPGDIVYDYGLMSEYQSKFWPIYNADKVDAVGVPLMRSIPFVAAVGNHDADTRDLDKHPDALAYYHYWSQPLNGPDGKEGSAFVPLLKGSDVNKKAFYTSAGDRYPRMSNFSFNYGNAHYVVLDADTYVDWTDKELTEWLTKDLESSQSSTWRFVVFHHPGFNSSREHFEQQQMRLLSPIFEKENVDIVFCGHVHNYQRSFPMQFKPDNKGTLLIGGKENKTIRGRVVTGKWTLDKTFDGKNNTKPKGVIYIVTGAGGQELYNPEQQNDPDSWQKFTDKFISTVHSFTVVDINGNLLRLIQQDANGNALDSFEIKK